MMPIYYTIESACETDETGKVYPQIQKLSPEYDNHRPDSIYNYLKKSHEINDIPIDDPNLKSFVLHRYAKPSDLLSNAIIGGNGLFVSNKLKGILQEFDLPPHCFYPSKVLYKKETLDNYFWFFFRPIPISNVDFGNSTFFVYKSFLYNEGIININSEEDYYAQKKTIKEQNPGQNITIWSSKVSFKKEFKLKELFTLSAFDSNVYISSKLKERLLEQNITGCKIEETDKIIR